MSEQAVSPADPGFAPFGALPYPPPRYVPPPRPRVVVRADLLPALSTASAVATLGLPLGWLWSVLAPPEAVGVLADPSTAPGGVAPLLGQSAHRFDALAVFVLLGMVAGLLTGAVLWQLRRRRGPVVLLGAVVGSVISAWLAVRIGEAFALARYPDLAATVQAGTTVLRAPTVDSLAVVLTQPLGVVVLTSLLVAWNGRDDLGRRLG